MPSAGCAAMIKAFLCLVLGSFRVEVSSTALYSSALSVLLAKLCDVDSSIATWIGWLVHVEIE